MADRRPLERGLARFLLEERGLFVVGEAATMADVLLQVQQLEPDLLVLHEKLALDHDPTVTAQIRRISPHTKIVLLSAAAETLPPALLLLAERVVVDGPGLSELGTAVAGPLPELDEEVTPSPVDGEAPVPVGAVVASHRWFDRLQGMAVASVIALALLFAWSMTAGVPFGTPREAKVHLSAAYASLDDLSAALPSASPETIAKLATALVAERARAFQAGADTSGFDQDVYEALAGIWSDLSPQTQAILLAVLGEILPPGAPPGPIPTPVTSPAPSPETEAPSPEPEPSTPPTTTEPPPTTTEPPPTTTEPPPTTTEPPPTTTEPPPTTTEPPPTTTEPPPTTTEPPPTTTEPPPTTTEPPPTTTEPPPTTTEPPPTTTEPPPTTTEPPPTTTEPPPTTTEPPPTTTEPPPTTTEPPPTTTEPPPSTTEPPTTSTGTRGLASGAETKSGILVVLPAGVLLMLTGSGVARRKATREDNDPAIDA